MPSDMPHANHPEHIACIEDALEDDDNTTIPGTRRSANVAAKRSKPLNDNAKIQSGEPVVRHSATDQANENDPTNHKHQRDIQYATKSSRVKSAEAMRPSSSKGKEPAEKGRRILDKLKPKSRKNDRGPSPVESREAAARMHLSGAPVIPLPPILTQNPQPPILMSQPLPIPFQPPPGSYPMPIHPGPNFPMGPPMPNRPSSFHAGVTPPMFQHPGYFQQRSLIPPQHQMLPPEFIHPQFMPGPSPTSAQRVAEYPFPASISYGHPNYEPLLQRVPSQKRRSVVFAEPLNQNEQLPWGPSSLPDRGVISIPRQPSSRRRDPRPIRMPGGFDYYEEDRERERIERERRDLERDRARLELERDRTRMDLERERERVHMERLDLDRREQAHIDRERRERMDRERMPPPQIHQMERPQIRRPATVANVPSSHRNSFVPSSASSLHDEARLSTFRSHDPQLRDEPAPQGCRHRESNASHKSLNQRSLTKKVLQRNQEEEERAEEAAFKHQEDAAKAAKTNLTTPTQDEIKRKLQQKTKTQASETGSRVSKVSKASRKSGSSEGKRRRDDSSRKGDGEEKMTVSMDANQNLTLDIVGDHSKSRTIEFRPNKDHDGGVAISIGGKSQRKDSTYHNSVSSARSGRSHRETIYEHEEADIPPPSPIRDTEYTRTSNDLRDGPSTRDLEPARVTTTSRRASLSRDPEYIKHTTTSTRRSGSNRETGYREGVRTESRMSRASTTVDDAPRRSGEDGSRRDREVSRNRPPLSGRWASITDERPRGSSRAPRAPSQSPNEDHPRSSSRASRVDHHEYRRESHFREIPNRESREARSPSPRKITRPSKVTTITKTSSRGTIPDQSLSSSPQEEDSALADEFAAVRISSHKNTQPVRSPSPRKQASPPAMKRSPQMIARTPSPAPKERANVRAMQDSSPFLEKPASRGESRTRRRSSSVMAGMRYVMGERRAREGEPF